VNNPIHLQAIVTKYYGPSNVRGSRIKASAQRGSKFFTYEPAISIEANHRMAARMLLDHFADEDVKKYGGTPMQHHWGEFVSGVLPSQEHAHVMLGRNHSVFQSRWTSEEAK
jgi:hypothetical protein